MTMKVYIFFTRNSLFTTFFIGTAALIAFIVSGWQASDLRKIELLIEKNSLKDPDKAFKWII